MEAKAIWERLRKKFSEEKVGDLTEGIPAGSEADGELGKKDYRPRDTFLVVETVGLLDVMQYLRSEPDLAFDFCMCITGVDLPAKHKLKAHQPEDKLGVVYHLYSYEHRHGLVVKVFTDRSNPHVPSVAGVWPTADWHERETYDLFGVIFDGHPDLRRIMLPEEFEGHPCRKDYVERPTVLGIPTTRYQPATLLGKLEKGTTAEKPE